MKAVFIEKFGNNETVRLGEVATPTIGPDDVLIRVSHAAVNPVDWKIREGYLNEMLPHKFPLVLGWDAAGKIEAVGENVKHLKKADRVLVYARKPEVQGGTYAEFLSVPSSFVALTPSNVDDAVASALPLAGLTAWQALFEVAQLKKGQTVLVHAAAGGVGSYAVQFAKLAGAKVIATASQEKHNYVKELGADEVIDYKANNFKQHLKSKYPEGIDVVLDAVGGKVLDESFEVIKKSGALVSIVDTPSEEKAKAFNIRAAFHFVAPNGSQLTEIVNLLSQAKIQAPKIEVLALEKAKEALNKSQAGRTTGKVVLKV